MTQKINVIHLLSSFYTGGIEKLLLNFLKESKNRNDNINYFVVVLNDKYSLELKEELEKIGYKTYFLNRKEKSKNINFIFDLIKIIIENKINIIHTHTNSTKIISIILKLLIPKLKLIYTIHSTTAFVGISKINLFFHKNFIDKNIAISDCVYNITQNKINNKIVKIYNGINLIETPKQYQNDDNKKCFNIIDIARINHKIKGQDILIKALNICKNKGLNFKCKFIGGIYHYGIESFEYLKKLIEQYQLEDYIEFSGEQNNIIQFCKNSDLAIFPSRQEGFGLAVIEVMDLGIPVICSNAGGHCELIEDNFNGLLFENENYTDLANKIMYILEDKSKRIELIKNAQRFVQKFDIKKMCLEYSKLYKNINNSSQNE